MSNNRRPVHNIRLGYIKAAIWEQQSGENTWHNVTIERSYRDGQDWKHTNSFNRDDLLLVAKAADQAHTWICEQRASRGDQSNR